MIRELSADLLLDCACETGESPVWNEKSQELWWTDIPGKKLHRLNAASGEHTNFEMPGRLGCFGFRETGGLVLAMEHGFYTYDPDTGEFQMLSEPEADLSSHRFNDGRCDRSGRFIAGSMNLTRDADSAKLWQLTSANEAPRVIVVGLTVSNGLAFNAEGSSMYLVDGGRRQIFRFAYSEEGMPFEQTLFQDEGTAPGRPDGGALDAEGFYWSARWQGACVARFAPDGRLDTLIHLPVSRVTMCAFGGSDLRTLFITTAWEGMTPEERATEPLAGSVFAIQPGVTGLTEPRFAG